MYLRLYLIDILCLSLLNKRSIMRLRHVTVSIVDTPAGKIPLAIPSSSVVRNVPGVPQRIRNGTDMFLFQLLERQQKKTGNERKLLPFKRWKTCLGIYRSSPRATFSLPVQQTNRWKERPVGQEVWLPRKRTAGVCGLNLLSLYRRIRKHLNKN